jgi:hypothetical protein
MKILAELNSGGNWSWPTNDCHSSLRSMKANASGCNLWMPLGCRYCGFWRLSGLLVGYQSFPRKAAQSVSRSRGLMLVAPRLWKSIVPSGTSDFQRIKDTVDDRLRVHEYATKYFRRAFSNEGFLTSNIMQDGRRSFAFSNVELAA